MYKDKDKIVEAVVMNAPDNYSVNASEGPNNLVNFKLVDNRKEYVVKMQIDAEKIVATVKTAGHTFQFDFNESNLGSKLQKVTKSGEMLMGMPSFEEHIKGGLADMGIRDVNKKPIELDIPLQVAKDPSYDDSPSP